MELHSLWFGKSKKKKLKVIMTDSFKKCEAYKAKREKTAGAKCSEGYHVILPAEEGSKGYKKTGTNKKSGWIGKNGFNPHT